MEIKQVITKFLKHLSRQYPKYSLEHLLFNIHQAG